MTQWHFVEKRVYNILCDAIIMAVGMYKQRTNFVSKIHKTSEIHEKFIFRLFFDETSYTFVRL